MAKHTDKTYLVEVGVKRNGRVKRYYWTNSTKTKAGLSARLEPMAKPTKNKYPVWVRKVVDANRAGLMFWILVGALAEAKTKAQKEKVRRLIRRKGE